MKHGSCTSYSTRLQTAGEADEKCQDLRAHSCLGSTVPGCPLAPDEHHLTDHYLPKANRTLLPEMRKTEAQW